jgi:hypothetical protein
MKVMSSGAGAILLALISLPCRSQQPTASPRGAAIEASSVSPCRLVVSTQNDQFTINCQGVAKEQADKLTAIVNKILANKLDPQLVMTKLDEMPKASKHDSPAKIYFCDGMWQSAGRKSDSLLDSKTGGNDYDFLNMIELFRNNHYPQLLKACVASINSVPDWLTPRLFCGLAYAHLDEPGKARSMLKEFESRAGPSYDSPPCHDMTVILRSLVK